jgi:glutamate--cysteine ligase
MSAPASGLGAPITDRRELAAYMESGNKPIENWRLGTEHEKFVFRLSDKSAPSYEAPDGIGALLGGLMRFGWQPVREGENIIALTRPDGSNVSLEPGGQLELSGAPLKTVNDTCAEVHTHLAEVKEVARELGLGLIGLGFNPKAKRADVPWMPKGRYKIMREYMPKRGSLGLDMMLRTCTVQVNLDFASEADMVKKFRVSLALQPIATALFANSPFTEGRPNGFKSFRSQVWTDTDPDRTGDLSFVFEDGFGFERYADYMLKVPMYFVYRDGKYIDASGQSFVDFLDGKLPALSGERPTITDWSDHLTTAFPEVRLKKFLEMRGADSGPWKSICALPAFWVGLLYDDTALDAAWDLVKNWSAEERAHLRREVPKSGLQTPFRFGSVKDLAARVLEISEAGLKARARRDGWGNDETQYLASLIEAARTGKSAADILLARFNDAWGRKVDPVYDEFAY